jgi:hypothetical protein
VRRSNAFFVLGLLLLVAGAALLVYGIIQYKNVSASLGNALGKLIKGSSAEENKTIIEMIAGGAGALLGIVLLFSGGRGRQRR